MIMSKIEEVNLLEFTNDLKKTDRTNVLEILDRINKVNKLEKGVIEKCLEIYNSIEAYKDKPEIRDNLEKAFNLLVSNLNWLDIVRINETIAGNEDSLKILDYIDVIEGKENEENVYKLEELINDFKGSNDVKKKFQRKLNLSKKRLERRTSENLGALFLSARNKSGLSLQELGSRTNCSSSYINRLEKGERRTPTIPILKKIANALDIDESSVWEILGIRGEKDGIYSFRDILYGNNFTVEGKRVKAKQKDGILQLISYIFTNNGNFETHDETRALIDFARSINAKKMD